MIFNARLEDFLGVILSLTQQITLAPGEPPVSLVHHHSLTDPMEQEQASEPPVTTAYLIIAPPFEEAQCLMVTQDIQYTPALVKDLTKSLMGEGPQEEIRSPRLIIRC